MAFPDVLELVPLCDHSALAQSLLMLLQNPARCQHLSENGRHLVARYDYRVAARAELEAIVKVCSQGVSSEPG